MKDVLDFRGSCHCRDDWPWSISELRSTDGIPGSHNPDTHTHTHTHTHRSQVERN